MEFLSLFQLPETIGSINTLSLVFILFMVSLLASLEYFVYKELYSNAFYSKAFHTNITILPFFISTIILALQSNLLITLGTIGALAIIRYRTAVKNPADMIFLLWAIHIGITCGCELYWVAVITSLIVSIILLFLYKFKKLKYPYCCIIHSKANIETEINNLFSQFSKKYKIKNRSYTANGYNFIVEIFIDEINDLSKKLEENEMIEKFSILEYDYEDIL